MLGKLVKLKRPLFHKGIGLVIQHMNVCPEENKRAHRAFNSGYEKGLDECGRNRLFKAELKSCPEQLRREIIGWMDAVDWDNGSNLKNIVQVYFGEGEPVWCHSGHYVVVT